MPFVLLISLVLSITCAESVCPRIERYYIIGNYSACVSVRDRKATPECKYLEALCEIGSYNYESARFKLSSLSSNPDALNSLTEIAFLQGNYKKARELAADINTMMSQKLPDSYPCIVSKILLVKSFFDAKDITSAMKRIEMLKTAKVDPILYSSVNP